MATTTENWPTTVMSRLSTDLADEKAKSGDSSGDSYSHINSQIKDAVGYSNETVSKYGSKETVIPYDIMVSQSAGQVSQAAAQYMDGVMQVTLASQSVLMKKLVEDVVSGNVKSAGEDGLGIAGLEALMSIALAVGAGTGVIEGAGAAKAVELMDSKLNTYMTAVNSAMNGSSTTDGQSKKAGGNEADKTDPKTGEDS